jgi:hypothetical protein
MPELEGTYNPEDPSMGCSERTFRQLAASGLIMLALDLWYRLSAEAVTIEGDVGHECLIARASRCAAWCACETRVAVLATVQYAE